MHLEGPFTCSGGYGEEVPLAGYIQSTEAPVCNYYLPMEVGRQLWVEYGICCVALAEVTFPESLVRTYRLSTGPMLAMDRHQ